MADVIVGRRVYMQIPMASSTRVIAPTSMYSIRFDIVKGLLYGYFFARYTYFLSCQFVHPGMTIQVPGLCRLRRHTRRREMPWGTPDPGRRTAVPLHRLLKRYIPCGTSIIIH